MARVEVCAGGRRPRAAEVPRGYRARAVIVTLIAIAGLIACAVVSLLWWRGRGRRYDDWRRQW